MVSRAIPMRILPHQLLPVMDVDVVLLQLLSAHFRAVNAVIRRVRVVNRLELLYVRCSSAPQIKLSSVIFVKLVGR